MLDGGDGLVVRPLPQKKEILLENEKYSSECTTTRHSCVLHGAFSAVFLFMPSPKMSNLLPEVVIWWTLKMYFLEVHIAHEYSVRVMGLERFLLHCNASNLLIYIFKHDKIWGTMCISVPTPNFGDSFPRFPVICARAFVSACR